MDLALNNLQRLICLKPTNQPTNQPTDHPIFLLQQPIFKKAQRKTGYSDQKQYRQNKHQQNKNNQKTKIERKTTVWIFQETNKKNVSCERIWTWLRKGNLKRETESLLRAAQVNAIKTNYVKARIDKTLQNRRCRLYSDRSIT